MVVKNISIHWKFNLIEAKAKQIVNRMNTPILHLTTLNI